MLQVRADDCSTLLALGFLLPNLKDFLVVAFLGKGLLGKDLLVHLNLELIPEDLGEQVEVVCCALNESITGCSSSAPPSTGIRAELDEDLHGVQ